MKTILIPADLSPEAENAFTYTVEFAMSVPEKIQLILLHVFQRYAADSDTELSLLNSELEAAEKATTEALQRMADKHLHAKGLNFKFITSRGFLKEEIAVQARENSADFIFMGTKGATGLLSAYFGSNTSDIIESAPCPVLAIPEKAFFTPLKRIVFASNFSDSDSATIGKAISLGEMFCATITLLHLSEKGEESLDLKVLEFIRTNMKSKTGYSRIEIATFYTENFVDGLSTELRNHQANMLVMSPRKHSLTSRLLNRSRTKQMVLHTHTPLLALPSAENALAGEEIQSNEKLQQLLS